LIIRFADKNFENECQIVSSAPRLFYRQVFPAWLAGAGLTALLPSGALIAYLLHGDWLGNTAFLSGFFLIPPLAMAYGVFSGNSKLFEVLYLLWGTMDP